VFCREYKAGGLNEGLFSAPYRPEKLTAFALGSKNRLLENRLLLNSEFFYWDYRYHQVATIAAVNPPPTIGYFGTNIPKSQLYGADLDLTALVTESDRVELSAEYLDGSHRRDVRCKHRTGRGHTRNAARASRDRCGARTTAAWRDRRS